MKTDSPNLEPVWGPKPFSNFLAELSKLNRPTIGKAQAAKCPRATNYKRCTAISHPGGHTVTYFSILTRKEPLCNENINYSASSKTDGLRRGECVSAVQKFYCNFQILWPVVSTFLFAPWDSAKRLYRSDLSTSLSLISLPWMPPTVRLFREFQTISLALYFTLQL